MSIKHLSENTLLISIQELISHTSDDTNAILNDIFAMLVT